MGNYEIGDYIKSKVKNQQIDIDTEQVWADIDLQEKEKRRGLIWLILFLGISLIFASVLIKPHIKESVKVDEAKESLSSDKLRSELLKDEKTYVNDEVISKKVSKIKDESNLQVSEIVYIEPSDASSFVNLQIKSINQSELGNTMASDDKKKHLIEVPSHALHKQKGDSNYFSNEVDESIDNLNIDLEQIGQLPLLNFKAPKCYYKYIVSEIKSPERFSFLNESKNDITVSNWSLDIYAGVYNIAKTLESKNSALALYIQKKKRSERPLEMILVGLEMKYNFESGLYLGLGLEYQKRNEIFQYVLSRQDTIPELNIFSDSYRLTTTNQEWINYNSYTNYVLPLTIGYSYKYARLQVGLDFKGLMSYQSNKGLYLNINEDVSTESNQAKNIAWGLRFGLPLSYDLGKNWTILLSPSFQKISMTYSVDSWVYKQKWSMLGINGGLQICF